MTVAAIIDLLKGLAVCFFGGTYQYSNQYGYQTITFNKGIVGVFFDWLTQDTVLPVFMIGMAVALVLLAVRIVKAIFWGT